MHFDLYDFSKYIELIIVFFIYFICFLMCYILFPGNIKNLKWLKTSIVVFSILFILLSSLTSALFFIKFYKDVGMFEKVMLFSNQIFGRFLIFLMILISTLVISNKDEKALTPRTRMK